MPEERLPLISLARVQRTNLNGITFANGNILEIAHGVECRRRGFFSYLPPKERVLIRSSSTSPTKIFWGLWLWEENKALCIDLPTFAKHGFVRTGRRVNVNTPIHEECGKLGVILSFRFPEWLDFALPQLKFRGKQSSISSYHSFRSPLSCQALRDYLQDV